MSRAAVASAAGCGHAENQDRALADPARGLYAVSDGMGGPAGGREAAELVSAALPAIAARVAAAPRAHALDVLGADLATLSRRVRASGQDGRGATVVAVLRSGDHLLVGHLGDSRAYLVRDAGLVPLTRDHNVATELVAAGRLTADEARFHRGRAQLTRYLGMPRDAVADVAAHPVAPGDRLVLCTDGLLDAVAEADLLAVLRAASDADAAVARISVALAAAAVADDATVVVADLERRPGGAAVSR